MLQHILFLNVLTMNAFPYDPEGDDNLVASARNTSRNSTYFVSFKVHSLNGAYHETIIEWIEFCSVCNANADDGVTRGRKCEGHQAF